MAMEKKTVNDNPTKLRPFYIAKYLYELTDEDHMVKAAGLLVECLAYAAQQKRDALHDRSRNECY